MGDQYPDEKNTLLPTWQQRIFILGFRLFLILQSVFLGVMPVKFRNSFV